MIEPCLHCHHSFSAHTGDGIDPWSTACTYPDCECKFYWDSEDEKWAREH